GLVPQQRRIDGRQEMPAFNQGVGGQGEVHAGPRRHHGAVVAVADHGAARPLWGRPPEITLDQFEFTQAHGLIVARPCGIHAKPSRGPQHHQSLARMADINQMSGMAFRQSTAGSDSAESVLTRAVLGPPGPHRAALHRLWLLLLVSGFRLSVVGGAVLMGRVPFWQWGVLATYALGGWVIFYLRMRSPSPSMALHGPTLPFALVLFSIGTVGLFYALVEPGRGLALQWLCLIVTFDMRRLTARQARVATLGGVGMIMFMMLVSWLIDPDSVHMKQEVANLVLAGLTLPALLVVTRIGRHLHRRLRDQEAAL